MSGKFAGGIPGRVGPVGGTKGCPLRPFQGHFSPIRRYCRRKRGAGTRFEPAVRFLRAVEGRKQRKSARRRIVLRPSPHYPLCEKTLSKVAWKSFHHCESVDLEEPTGKGLGDAEGSS